MRNNNSIVSMIHLTYNTHRDLSDQPNFIQGREMTKSLECGSVEKNYSCQKTISITTSKSNVHLVVEIIKREDWCEQANIKRLNSVSFSNILI
jgi:hypothetical protein